MKTYPMDDKRYKLEVNTTVHMYDFGKDKYGKWEVCVVETERELEAYVLLHGIGAMDYMFGTMKEKKCFICPPEEMDAFLGMVDATIDEHKEYYVKHYVPELIED